MKAIGTSNWASRITPAIRTYPKKDSLTDKKVAKFIIQDGDTPFPPDQIKFLLPDAVWVAYISITKALKKPRKKIKSLNGPRHSDK